MLKNHSTIGCCNIDCGLCPRYYTRGTSACPGCGAVNLLDNFDDGRSKSFYCLTCALFPVEMLIEFLPENQVKPMQLSEVRERIYALANVLNIGLKLRK